ncbi:cupin domain-containing protein [Dactylosporangium sp. NPDC005572]|uniref:cupin domain-containing protein n=1 Tax=Dactylosporangium sp. NPDC005572 TaxID=3156889 RepID=UPI0033ADBCD2
MTPRAYVAGPGPHDPFAVLADATRTAGALGVVVCAWRPGEEPAPHSMPGTDQALVVLDGACALTVDGEPLHATAGVLAFVPRGARLSVRVTGEPCRVLRILAPAGAETYLATAAAVPGLGAAALLPLAADHGVVLHPE